MAKVIILNENQFGEMMAYHGSSSDFDKFNHKKYLGKGAGSQTFGWGTYITNDIEIAKSYAENIGKGNYIIDYDNWLKQGLTFDEITKWPAEKKYLEEFINNHIDDFKKANINEFDISYVGEIIWGIFKHENFDKDFAINSLKRRIKNKTYECDGYGRKLPDETCENKFRQYTGALRALEIMKSSNNKIVYEVEIPDDNGHNYLSWYDNVDYSIFDTIQQKLEEFSTRFNLPKLNYGWNRLDRISYDFKGLYRDVEDRFDMCGIQGNKAASLLFMQCGFDGIKYPAGTRWQKPDGASEDAMNYVIFDANKVKIINKTKV